MIKTVDPRVKNKLSEVNRSSVDTLADGLEASSIIKSKNSSKLLFQQLDDLKNSDFTAVAIETILKNPLHLNFIAKEKFKNLPDLEVKVVDGKRAKKSNSQKLGLKPFIDDYVGREYSPSLQTRPLTINTVDYNEMKMMPIRPSQPQTLLTFKDL